MNQLWFLLLCGRSVNWSNSFLIGLFGWFIVILSPAVTVYSVIIEFTVWTMEYTRIHSSTCAKSEATDGIMPRLQFYFTWAEWLQVLIHCREKHIILKEFQGVRMMLNFAAEGWKHRGTIKTFPVFYACIYKPLSMRFIVHSLLPTDNNIKHITVSSKLYTCHLYLQKNFSTNTKHLKPIHVFQLSQNTTY
jgi:hypothetical protein